jgi:hypothetical protein
MEILVENLGVGHWLVLLWTFVAVLGHVILMCQRKSADHGHWMIHPSLPLHGEKQRVPALPVSEVIYSFCCRLQLKVAGALSAAWLLKRLPLSGVRAQLLPSQLYGVSGWKPNRSGASATPEVSGENRTEVLLHCRSASSP